MAFRKYFAELLGTALLSLGFKLDGMGVSAGVVTTALSFRLALVYAIGPISGRHGPRPDRATPLARARSAP
jgi:hypothetical protein